MYLRIACVVVALFLLGIDRVAADEQTRPTVEYQADVRIEAGSLVLSGPVQYAPDKERRTLMLQGTSIPARVMIIRRDKNVGWVLDKQSKSYFAVSLPSMPASESSSFSTSPIEKIKIRSETIDGIEATKYRVKFTETKDGQLVGYIWLTPNNIALRFEGEFLHKGQPAPFRMNLTNLKIGPQPAEVFEVPKDFRLVPANHPTMGIFGPPGPHGSAREMLPGE